VGDDNGDLEDLATGAKREEHDAAEKHPVARVSPQGHSMVASPYMKRESVTAAIALCAVTLSCTPASGPEQPSQPPARFVAFRAPKIY